MLNIDIGMLVTCHYDIIHHAFSVADGAIMDGVRLRLGKRFATFEKRVATHHRPLATHTNHGYCTSESRCWCNNYIVVRHTISLARQ